MPETIPSIYSAVSVGTGHDGGTLPNGNVRLRFGEVKREILPKDKESYSKKYREYEVMVQHYEGGSASSRLYHHCMVLSDLGSMADYSTQALRTSNESDYKLGNGSKVFILCVEGNDSRAVIIGGPQQKVDSSKGIHREMEFNGVNFQVFDDGSFEIVNKGKTDNDGKMHKDADKEGAGTKVKVEANGNFTVATPGNKCSVSINHKSGTIDIKAPDSFTINTSKATVNADTVDVKAMSVKVDSPSVEVGTAAVQHALLGETLVALLVSALGTIMVTLPSPAQQQAIGAIITTLSNPVSPVFSKSVKVGV
jgi:hypothetical protein